MISSHRALRAGPCAAAKVQRVRVAAAAAAPAAAAAAPVLRGQHSHALAPAATPMLLQQQQQQQQRQSRRRGALIAPAAVPAAAPSGSRAAAAAGDDDSSDAEAFAVALAQVCDDTKAQDLVVLHVAPLVSWTSYFVVATVTSKPQLMAVLARAEATAEGDFGRRKQNSPGSSPWEVLDYGDVVLHVFTPDQRETYDIESFYAAAEEVPLPFVAEGSLGGGGADGGGSGGSGSSGGGGWSTSERF